MDGIALPYSDLPVELIQRHHLDRHVHARGGEREFRFLRRTRQPLLPVWHAGQLRIVPWGCPAGPLPRNGLTWLHSVENGAWANQEVERVEIPAALGLENGVWYRVHRGVKGILAEVNHVVAAYVLVEPASYYYRIMTRSERMPLLIGERI